MRTSSRIWHQLFPMASIGLLIGCILSTAVGQSPSYPIAGTKGITFDPINDWPWWRGPNRDGSSLGAPAPDTLDESKNLVWKTPVPGRGHSSPIVVGKRVFLLSADNAKQVHFVMAFDRDTGKELWKRELNQGGFPAKNHPKNTEASPTLACDGNHLFSALFHHEAVWGTAIDLDGKLVWETKLGAFNPKQYEYGYAPSPVLYNDSVLFTYEYDGPSAIVALERISGVERWRTDRPQSTSFSTPVVMSHGDQDYLLISGIDKVSAYDPANGKLRWETKGTTMATCGTMVWDNGIVFASGGYPRAETIAIDVKTGNPLWKNNQKAYEQSMVAHAGHLYCLTDNGVLFCWDGTTGEEKWKQRLSGPVSASGVLVGNRIYWANERGDLFVFEANPERFVQVSKNKIGDESFASPAICNGQVYLRVATFEGDKRQEYLMRLGNQ
ncbi:PQQ-binding-like beta-propeller repeat protein [Pirellula sp. SH-Sr6A]|uniref:outer membrane protein assembly factor BamB family protein n=1 Tax=Pirellula sp. SH-Sr6A TaxID=1632865 RepID=UPI001439667A|nr:PQQ-binding-like beta-propeller repeat protein [Pirellula sp. SH-Sr6A]